MEGKQTAVEFLLSELDIAHLIAREKLTMAAEVVRQAKAMEMDQHDLTFARGVMTGYANANGHESVDFEQYFEKTYGAKKNSEESTN